MQPVEMAAEGDDLQRSTVSFAGPADPARPAAPLLSTRGHRYVIQRQLGRGGMAEVFAAHDATLDRTVAVKILRPELRAAVGGSLRLVREAQALARLRHENVVAVYDVGLLDDQLFLAMEYVEGSTLRAWLAERRRGPAEIVAVFLAAGRGLVAAHAAGLVHRDFKPDNVLLGKDGSVRVADFGLARLAGDATEAAAATGTPAGTEPFGSITRTGALLGTPPYMAPELLRGEPADERSDQFAFAASLHEALHGAPPFAGRTPAELLASIAAGPRAPAGDVPAAVRAAVKRGLAIDPAARFPSMRDLLAALDRATTRRRRLAILAAGAAGVAALAAGGVALTTRGASSCGGAEARLAGVWDPEVARRVGASFAGLALPHAQVVWPLVSERLDRYRAGWIASRVQICRTAEQGERSPRALDLGMACLDRGRAQLDELAARLARPDRAIVNGAVRAADGLPDPAACADVALLGVDVPPPADAATRDAVAALGEELARIDALEGLAQVDGAVRRAEAAVATARALAYPPALADALGTLGRARNAAEQQAQAIAPLEEALAIAFAARHDARVAEILTQLVRAAGKLRRDDADRWFALGSAAIERLGGDARAQATLRCNYALRFNDPSRSAEMLEHARACVELSGRAFGEESVRYGSALRALGVAKLRAGQHQDGERDLERALALLERGLGSDHGDVVDTLTNLSAVERYTGDVRSAVARARRALELKTRILGPDDPRLAIAYQNLGITLGESGDIAAGLPHLEAAHRLNEAALGPRHASIGQSLGNLAIAHVMAGKLDRARELAARSVEILEANHPQPHEDVVNAHTLLGTIERMRGSLDASLARLEHAVDLSDQAMPPGNPQRVNPLLELGHTLAARGEPARAVTTYERAAALFANPDVPPQWVGETRFALARALVAARRDPRRAREQATLAREVYARLGAPYAAQVREIDGWLDAR